MSGAHGRYMRSPLGQVTVGANVSEPLARGMHKRPGVPGTGGLVAGQDRGDDLRAQVRRAPGGEGHVILAGLQESGVWAGPRDGPVRRDPPGGEQLLELLDVAGLARCFHG